MRKFLESPVNDMVDKNVRNYIAKLEKENRSMNWQFWVLVILILISDFVIMVYINQTYENDKITRQTIVDISRDTYQIKDSVDSY